ncbi:MAG TPA: PEP-CTERM sorting domain-containing protein [Verrucomicrobiae bacterium]|nr:PEP-CTERM sorting domain-containing protein [Verrucomicrobiae bacterium]
MKRIVVTLALGIAVSALQTATAQTILVNSWENSVEGWGTLEANWTSGGFSTTTGVTQGSYSWILNAAGSPDYGAALGGTASTALTADLANAASVSVDVYATGFSYMQWDLTLNGGGLGYQSTDGYTYSQSPVIGTESTLTFTIPSSFRATLAANPTIATSLNFQIGGGNPGTVYLDNLVVTEVPEPASLALMGLGAVGLVLFRRRNS